MDLTERFIIETAEHEMTVLHDAGDYQHLRCLSTSNPEYGFHLLTAPGTLVYRGVDAAYVFSATNVLDLFRAGRHRDGTLHIDPGYWATKLAGKRVPVMDYSVERFEQYAAELIAAAEEKFPGVGKAWAAYLEGECEFYTEAEVGAREALAEFTFGARQRSTCSTCDGDAVEYPIDQTTPADWVARHRGLMHLRYTNTLQGFRVPTPPKGAFEDYSRQYLFACCAIVWGLDQYDRHRKALTADADAPVLTAVA